MGPLVEEGMEGLERMKIAVIGSGLAGLSVANLLSAQNEGQSNSPFEVDVYEKVCMLMPGLKFVGARYYTIHPWMDSNAHNTVTCNIGVLGSHAHLVLASPHRTFKPWRISIINNMVMELCNLVDSRSMTS